MCPAGRATTLTVSAACLLLTGCVSSPRSDVTVLESPRGTVSLEQIPDRSLPAAHPILLEPSLIARVLRGVRVGTEQSSGQTSLSQRPTPAQVFTEEDVQLLAPAIATALDRATRDQRVAFRAIHPASPISLPSPPGSRSETTSGTLYAYGLSLYLTLTEYRRTPEPPDTGHRQNRNEPPASAHGAGAVTFMPEIARRRDKEPPGNVLGDPFPPTLVIDYQLLAKLPSTSLPLTPASEKVPIASTMGEATAPVAASTGTAAAGKLGEAEVLGEELRSLRDLVSKKDTEIEVLKKELKSIRRQLADLDAQIDSLKRRGTAPAK